MSSFSRFLTSRWGPIFTGLVVGILAALLWKLGNPGNMGICMVCFCRDIAGALGLHSAKVVQYIRPEVIGFALGALGAALVFREFKPRTGSSPLVRFFLGIFASVGALVFLGCPWRAYLRLSGGDWNAIFGILGLVVGISIGVLFFRMGFSLGRNRPAPRAFGWVMPIFAIALLLLLLFAPQFGKDSDGNPSGPIFFSVKGPGSMYAPWILSLAAGLIVGFLAQRSRFCTVGGVRDLILLRDGHLFNGIIAFLVAAFAMNLVLGQFRAGFEGQPVAHTNGLWNFAGMVLAGLCFTLGGGCPGRQVILAGEGDGDASIFVMGVLVGAGVSHNFLAAGSPKGPGPHSAAFVITGLIVCIVIGLTMREPGG